jgi:hypothetical protein
MQSAQRHGLKKKSHSTNQFNHSEYSRWSDGLKASQSRKTECEIESFLGTTEILETVHENISVSLKEIGEQ